MNKKDERKLINEDTYPKIVHEDVTMARRHRVVILVTDDDAQERHTSEARCTRIRDRDGNVVFFNLFAVKRHNRREDITCRRKTMSYVSRVTVVNGCTPPKVVPCKTQATLADNSVRMRF